MAKIDYDIVVVGGGGAGLAAANTAGAAGARVLIVEAAERLGGSTALSGGVFYAANTSVQRAAGIVDSPEALFRYYMSVNGYRLQASLIRRFATESAPTFEWLLSLGVRFPAEHLYAAGLDGVPRGHRAKERGREIVDRLEGSLRTEWVDVALRSRASAIHRSATGQVEAVGLGAERVRCRAAILTTGGFGASPELLSRYFPSASIYGDWVWYVGCSTCRGDGISLGLAAGATMTGLDTGSTVLTPGFTKSDFEPYIPGWFIFVDREGRRFADETLDYSVSSNQVRKMPGGECFALFDENARLAARPSSAKSKDQTNAYPFASWTAERLGAMADAGRVFRASSLEALADLAGIQPARLAQTVATFNRDCDLGADTMFGKSRELLRPLRCDPFYAVRIRPAIVGSTGAGLRTDADARLLTDGDTASAGLYAAGETVGGVHGECYVGGGGSIANAIVFGRIAAQSALADLARGSAGTV